MDAPGSRKSSCDWLPVFRALLPRPAPEPQGNLETPPNFKVLDDAARSHVPRKKKNGENRTRKGQEHMISPAMVLLLEFEIRTKQRHTLLRGSGFRGIAPNRSRVTPGIPLAFL